MQQLPASHQTAKALPPKPHRPPKSVMPPQKRGPSNLDFKTPLKSRDGKVPLKALKCACRKAWCQTCGKLSAIKRFIEYIRDWDYRYVRQIILTVDRDLYSSPEEALNTIKGKKHIAALIRNLERTKKIGILDWAWILEWHRDGYPHWHLFILVDKAGQAGQIGFRNIGQKKGSSPLLALYY